MKVFLYIFAASYVFVLTTGQQFFSSGFYQGGFQAGGYSPFPFYGGHPFGGGLAPIGYGGPGNAQTHVHYHVTPNRGGGFGGFGQGINSRDVGSGNIVDIYSKRVLTNLQI